jgi:hypothetical protein
MENSTNSLPRNGFSIATLLLLVAVVAIFFAAAETTWLKVDKLDRTKPTTYYWMPAEPSPFERQMEALAERAVGGAIIGIFIGLAAGVTRSRRFFGTLLTVPAGAVAGAMAAALFTQPENVLLVVVGSVVLVLLGVVVQVFSSHPR